MSRMMLSARVLIENINCFSLTAMSVASVIATAVALRGAESISAISLKIFPGERDAIANADLHFSTFNDEQLLAGITLFEDDVAGLQFAQWTCFARDYSKIKSCIGHIR